MANYCVFCGSSAGFASIYTEVARSLGKQLAARNHQLVYGGGRVGLMGEVATAVLQSGGKVLGVIPEALQAKEIALTGVTELIVVDTMHQRKAIMADRADGFIALPGGFGTCDELFEILTWGQLGIHAKPISLLNINGFYDSLLVWLEHMVAEGFLKPKHRELLMVEEDVEELLNRLDAYKPKVVEEKWIEKQDR